MMHQPAEQAAEQYGSQCQNQLHTHINRGDLARSTTQRLENSDIVKVPLTVSLGSQRDGKT